MRNRTSNAIAAVAVLAPLLILSLQALGINVPRPFQLAALAVVLALLVAVALWWCFPGVRQRWFPEPSPFVIEYDPTDDQCVQRRDNHPQQDLQLRVKVRTSSKIDLRNVRVMLDGPETQAHWLRVRHDNTPPFALSLAGIELSSQSSRVAYFDVVFCQLGAPNIVFQYADQYLLQEQLINPVHRETCRFSLEVEGRSYDDGRAVPSFKASYQVEPSDNGGLTLKKVGG